MTRQCNCYHFNGASETVFSIFYKFLFHFWHRLANRISHFLDVQGWTSLFSLSWILSTHLPLVRALMKWWKIYPCFKLACAPCPKWVCIVDAKFSITLIGLHYRVTKPVKIIVGTTLQCFLLATSKRNIGRSYDPAKTLNYNHFAKNSMPIGVANPQEKNENKLLTVFK